MGESSTTGIDIRIWGQTMTENEADAIALIEEFTEAVNAGNYDSLNRFFSDDYDEMEDPEWTVAEVQEHERERAAAFSEKHEEIEKILTSVEDSESVEFHVWNKVTGTHVGEYIGIPPTGNDVEFWLARRGIIQNGKLTKYDAGPTLGILLHLGLNWDRLTDEVDLEEFMTSPEEAHEAAHGG